tara:strand:+ start:52 stop:561 length:510 start_codon:yes stop_codon:yes gene_type:complete
MQGRTRRGVSVSNKYSRPKASPNQLQRNKSNKPKASPNQLQINKSNKPKASPNQLQKNKSNKNLNIFDKGKTPKGKKEKVNKPTPKTGGSPNQKLKEEKRKNINRPGKNDNKIPTGVNRPGTDSKKPKSKIKSLTTDYIKQNLTFGPILGPSFFLTKNLYEQYLKKKKA